MSIFKFLRQSSVQLKIATSTMRDTTSSTWLRMPDLPIIARAHAHGSAVAFRDPRDGTTTTYHDLLNRSAIIASNLLSGSADVITLLVLAGPLHVAMQWCAWRAGAIVVPMCTSATELE